MKFEISKICKKKGYILEDNVGNMHFQNFKKISLFGVLKHYITKKFDVIFFTCNFGEFWAS